MRRRVMCKSCGGTLRIRLEQIPQLVFHRCEAGRAVSEPRTTGLPAPVTNAERRRGVFGRFLDAIEDATEDELRAETGTIDDDEECPRGHLWADNASFNRSGWRYCRGCRREKEAARRRALLRKVGDG